MRILINIIIILLLPFFIREEEPRDLLKKETALIFCDTDLEYCLEYPDSLLMYASGFEGKNGITLISEDGNTKLTIHVDTFTGQQNTSRRFEELIRNKFNKNYLRWYNKAINESYCEASFEIKNRHFYLELHHFKDKIILMEIVSPAQAVDKTGQLKQMVSLEAGYHELL